MAQGAPTLTHALSAEGSTPNASAPMQTTPKPLPTTLRPQNFTQILSNYLCHQFVDAFLTQLTTGFDIGYHGPHSDLQAPNLTSASQYPSAIDHYLHSDCKQDRMAGPFDEPPFSSFRCAGMGVVLKQDGSWQVITHLSAPKGQSINTFIDHEAVTLKYTKVDNAIHLANQLGRGTLLAKIDLEKTFRQCPVWAADWHLTSVKRHQL